MAGLRRFRLLYRRVILSAPLKGGEMEDISDIALRRWAVQQVLTSACFEGPHDTTAVFRLAMELVDFVKTGTSVPALPRPPAGVRIH